MTKFYARAVFFVRDASRSLEFFTRELGFSLDWTYEEGGKPHVFQVSLHGFELISSSTLRAGKSRPQKSIGAPPQSRYTTRTRTRCSSGWQKGRRQRHDRTGQ